MRIGIKRQRGVCALRRSAMTPGDRYRAKALELLARAEVESSPVLKVEFEELAGAYLRLAQQAERNDALIDEFELPRKQKSKP